MKRYLVASLVLFCQFQLLAQCKINNEINPSGVLILTTTNDTIYFNNHYTIRNQIRKVGSDMFLVLSVSPVSKIKVDEGILHIKLETKDSVDLEFHNSSYQSKDSSIRLLYKLMPEQIEVLEKVNVADISVMYNTELKEFILVNHRDFIRKGLDCLRKYEAKE